MKGQKEYYAFISYKREDEKWAKWLQDKLETYKLPSVIRRERGDVPKYIRPIFRDDTDLTGGVLADKLHNELFLSKYLIVICSPNATKSEWINKEINSFLDEGEITKIIPFIVGGIPHSKNIHEECFPEAILKIPSEKELLGINVKEVGKEKAFIRLVAYLLDLKFDILWQRHRRREKNRKVMASCILCLAFFLLYVFAIPVWVSIKIVDERHQLPYPKDAEIIVDGSHYPISKLDTTLTDIKFPGYMKMSKIDILFKATYYNDINCQLSLHFGWKNCAEIRLQRDNTFAIFGGVILDENGHPVENALIAIDSLKCISNSLGMFKISIPAELQSTSKIIMITKEGYELIKREEIPFADAQYILFHDK